MSIKKFIQYGSLALSGVLLVTMDAYAATTISTYITTGGNIYASSTVEVTGNITVPGGYTLDTDTVGGILNIGTTSATAIDIGSNTGFAGVATTTPWGLFSVNPSGIGNSPMFAIGSSSQVTKFIVNNGGNVGIGTTTPGALFAVGNGTTAGGVYIASGNLGIGTTSPLTALTVGLGDVLSVPQGAAATPALAFITDLASGIWQSAVNVLNFSTKGTERARIDANGNFGVGSTTPTALFGINANGLTAPTPQFAVGSTTGTNFLVANGGNVGIGTSTTVSGPILTVGVNQNTTAASTTIIMGKLQFQGQTSSGITICVFFNGASGATASTTISTGACNN